MAFICIFVFSVCDVLCCECDCIVEVKEVKRRPGLEMLLDGKGNGREWAAFK